MPDSLAYNRQFKKLVAQGVKKVNARYDIAQKVLLSVNAKAFQKAQAARKASRAARQASLVAQAKSRSNLVAPEASSEAAAPAKGAIKPGKATAINVAGKPSKGS